MKLINQQIINLNIELKNTIEVNKLLYKDWSKVKINKKKKKIFQYNLLLYIKAKKVK